MIPLWGLGLGLRDCKISYLEGGSLERRRGDPVWCLGVSPVR